MRLLSLFLLLCLACTSAERDPIAPNVTPTPDAPGRPTAAATAPAAAREVVRGVSAESPSAPRALLPPNAALREATGGVARLRIVPRESSGHVLVASPGGAIYGRHRVIPRPLAAARAFEVELSGVLDDAEVWLAHEAPDGARSDWRRVSLQPDGDSDR